MRLPFKALRLMLLFYPTIFSGYPYTNSAKVICVASLVRRDRRIRPLKMRSRRLTGLYFSLVGEGLREDYVAS